MKLESLAKAVEGKVAVESQRPARPAASFRLSSGPLHQLPHALGNQAFGQFIQAKLQISQPGDQYEQEADRVAEHVMRMPDQTAPIEMGGLPQISRLQRKCAQCEEEEIQRQPMEDEEETLQPKFVPGNSLEASSEASARVSSFRGGGQFLPDSARTFSEPRFGRDFSQVRVHTDAQAAQSAQAVNALAFTVGQDIVFGTGQYAPATVAGNKLLAHELTHVVQQGSQGLMLQRFQACETAENCPARNSGEEARSRSTPLLVKDFASPTFGILISNFAVDEHHAKPDLHTSLTWINLLAHIGLAASDEWEILGFSDCKGPESRNAALRQDRAEEIAALLPAATRASITNVSAAAISECIGSNASESDRSLNRSVLIRRLPGSTGPTAPAAITPVGPQKPSGTPLIYCVPYTGLLAGADASYNRLFLENVWLPLVGGKFGADVQALWRDYLNRPKGASLAPRVFRGSSHPIVEAFRVDPETVLHRGQLFTEIATAAGQTPEATIPLTGTASTSPPIPLGALLPSSSLIRAVNYTDPDQRIPGNIAGGSGTVGIGSSDAGPDLRLFTGSVRIERSRPTPGSPEVKLARIDLRLQVIDAVDFCPGNPGGSLAQVFTIPMSRLEATPTETTYDLPFHVFVDLSGTVPIP